MNLIIVFAHRRTDLLLSCLERLAVCAEIDNHEVWIVDDKERKTPEEEQNVRRVCERAKHTFSNSRYLEMYATKTSWDSQIRAFEMAAYSSDARLVHLLEDDVMVAPDFLQWGEMAHKFSPLLTCAVNIWTKRTGSPSEVCISNSDYAHWGVCMHRELLREAVKRPFCHPEESFHNLVLKNRLTTLFPIMPRAVNVGLPKGPGADFSYEPAKSLCITEDRRELWQAAYEAQAKFGF